MSSKIITLSDSQDNTLIPKTKLEAISDANGNYLSNQLTASDINALTSNSVVTHDDISVHSSIPINADRLNGHADTYFGKASDVQANADAITSLNEKKIIRIKDVNIGNISIPSTGYVNISSYRPSYDGYSLLSCAIKKYGSFTAGTPAGFFVDANGNYITGPASSTIANITVRYIFVKTENLYDN